MKLRMMESSTTTNLLKKFTISWIHLINGNLSETASKTEKAQARANFLNSIMKLNDDCVKEIKEPQAFSFLIQNWYKNEQLTLPSTNEDDKKAIQLLKSAHLSLYGYLCALQGAPARLSCIPSMKGLFQGIYRGQHNNSSTVTADFEVNRNRIISYFVV